MAGLAEIALQFTQWANGFIGAWGYVGIFLVSLVSNASIILPLPNIVFVFALGAVLNPWLLGLVAGAGAALGETTGYVLGRGGRKAVKGKEWKWLKRAEKWAKSRGMFPVVFIFAASPLPDDVTGILCGMIKYDFRKFLLASLLGKVVFHVAVAWAGFYGLQYVLAWLGG
jgi:membrane protein YqaA with SNARE-associated domain